MKDGYYPKIESCVVSRDAHGQVENKLHNLILAWISFYNIFIDSESIGFTIQIKG
jgi:hypothetical protein